MEHQHGKTWLEINSQQMISHFNYIACGIYEVEQTGVSSIVVQGIVCSTKTLLFRRDPCLLLALD